MPLPFDPIDEAKRNWNRHGWGAPEAMGAATAITRAHQIVLGRINEALGPYGLTFSRFEALALLHFTQTGSLPLGKVGERLQVHPASVTSTIDRLERDRLVKRTPHPTDGRTTLAEITHEGRDLVERAAAALATIDFALTGLQPDQLTAIDDAILPLRQAADDF